MRNAAPGILKRADRRLAEAAGLFEHGQRDRLAPGQRALAKPDHRRLADRMRIAGRGIAEHDVELAPFELGQQFGGPATRE
jgi:hypothetical protein